MKLQLVKKDYSSGDFDDSLATLSAHRRMAGVAKRDQKERKNGYAKECDEEIKTEYFTAR
jgi:hypothetical protein